MKINQLVISIVIILIPGIIATIIGDKITEHSKWDSFKFGVYSLMLGLLSYCSLQLIVFSIDLIKAITAEQVIWTQLDVWNIALNKNVKINPSEVVFASFLAIPVAFFVSWIINYKILNKIGKIIKITNKFGDENLYSFYLNAKEIEWVYIRDIENNLTYQGEVVSYSENDKMQEIVLSKVTVFRYQDSQELYSIPSIYLCKELGNFIIEAIPENFMGGENATRNNN